ncbi:hypothetical protein [Halorubrum saccharovorum]|uniref:hypothetical protein n=1 Tax=Halorubrum saccharovorum TaxID=2248 RepID=UPI000678AC6E|nr:hypothetical protein [Halorubrum saccharovorum]
MRGVPGDLTTSTRPPTTIPLRHFLVALAFLVAGGALGLLRVAGVAGAGPGLDGIAVAHLLLVGWVCLTIIGAMTQFVPVWSGVEIHSERLATLQLVAVAVGVAGFAAGLWLGRPADAALAAGVMAVGIGVFAYNIARTLWRRAPSTPPRRTSRWRSASSRSRPSSAGPSPRTTGGACLPGPGSRGPRSSTPTSPWRSSAPW